MPTGPVRRSVKGVGRALGGEAKEREAEMSNKSRSKPKHRPKRTPSPEPAALPNAIAMPSVETATATTTTTTAMTAQPTVILPKGPPRGATPFNAPAEMRSQAVHAPMHRKSPPPNHK
jgi:hypothetical protein